MAIEAPRINDARSAARALVTSRAVSFRCTQDRAASIERLHRIVIPETHRPRNPWCASSDVSEALHPYLVGFVDHERVTLQRESRVQNRFGRTRFEGHWVEDEQGTRLEGVVRPPTLWSWILGHFPVAASVAFVIFWFYLLSSLASRWTSWGWAGLALVVSIVLPIAVTGLGSARAAHEMDLIRHIGGTIGDPAEYAPSWRRWRED